MKYILHTILCLILTLIVSCSSKDKEQRDIVAEWIGKELIIPDSLQAQIGDTPIDYDFNDADFKIVTYVDSTGCTECNMQLQIWNEVINDLKSTDNVDVNFLMIVNSNKPDQIESLLKRDMFKHPITIDPTDRFKHINQFPDKNQYQTFLLDSDNKILALGNPANNPKIFELYQKIILGDTKQSSEQPNLCVDPNVGIGIINSKDTVTVRYSLYNQTEGMIRIQSLNPSCNCVSATAQSDTIKSGGNSIITVRYIASSIPGTIKKTINIFYNEFTDPEQLSLNGYIINQFK